MPTYRSITLSLVSQFDIMSIPEFPPQKRPTPFKLPTLTDDEHSLVSVFIPTYPCSQFWIAYSIAPPCPPKSLFYFKLFLNGACVANWGCDKQNEFKGKTMFGLYRSNVDGKEELETPEMQKRMICFGQGYRSSVDDVLEIRVYRCKGRKRCPPVLERYGGESVETESKVKKELEGSISLVNIGTADRHHPRAYYNYALIDPIDKPFSVFRYYYRTWEQLQNLGVVSASPTPSPSLYSRDEEVVQDDSHYGSDAEEEAQDDFHHDSQKSAFPSSVDISPVRSSISDSLSHLRPMISRGASFSVASASLSSSTTAPPSPTSVHLSKSSPAILTASSRMSRSSEVSSGAISRPTIKSFASLVRRSFSPAETIPPTPHPIQPKNQPRTANLGMLKNVVNRAVKRREKVVNEAEATGEGKVMTERPGSRHFIVQEDVSLQTSSRETTTQENERGDNGNNERGRSRSKSNEKRRSRSRSSIWQAL